MRVFLFTFFALFAAAVSASASSTLVKTLDGLTVYCNGSQDIGRVGYVPSSPELLERNGRMGVGLTLDFVRCEAAGWGPRLPFANIESRDRLGRPVTIKLRSLQAMLARSQGVELLATLPLENSARQWLEFPVEVGSLFTAEEQGRLRSGESVTGRATFLVRSEATAVNHSGEAFPLGRRAGGAFTIFVTAKLEAGEVRLLAATTAP